MNAPNERVVGGLFALTVEEAWRLLDWYEDATDWAKEGEVSPGDVALHDRLVEWARRHTESET